MRADLRLPTGLYESLSLYLLLALGLRPTPQLRPPWGPDAEQHLLRQGQRPALELLPPQRKA